MPDPAPNAELLQSLGRLARGLSAMFWGLPLALILCVGTGSAGWLKTFGVMPAFASTGLLFYGLWQLGHFQKQERPWRSALDRAKLLALINFGLSPFLYWWNRIPENPFFSAIVSTLAISALLFLLSLNFVLQRLGQMLPDETLRHETKQFTAFNCNLLTALLLLTALYLFLTRIPGLQLQVWAALLRLDHLTNREGIGLLRNAVLWLAQNRLYLTVCLLLLPLAMTMALIWKTKEVILDSVFNGKN